MSITVHVEYQYRQKGRKEPVTGSERVFVRENDERLIRAALRLLHPHWEDIKVLSVAGL